MRVVVDTNILISFAIRPNLQFETLFDHLSRHCVVLVSDLTIAELADVLARDKFRKYLPCEESAEYIEWYRGISEHVPVNRHVVACRDPRDGKFLSLAVSGMADCIVAGDRDLLDMVAFENIPVYRPAEFLKRFVRPD